MIYFLNSTNRVYEDKDINKINGILFNEGVFNTKNVSTTDFSLLGDLAIQPSDTTMDLTVLSGAFAIKVVSNGVEQMALGELENDTTIQIPVNNTGDDVYDAIIVRVDKSVIDGDTIDASGSNLVTIDSVRGGSNAPTDAEISTAIGGDYFLRLGDIYVLDGATHLEDDAVENDTRHIVNTSNAFIYSNEKINFEGKTIVGDRKAGDFWFDSTNNVMKLQTSTGIITFSPSNLDFYTDGVAIKQDSGNAIVTTIGSPENGSFYLNSFPIATGTYVKSQFLQPFTLTDTFGSFEFKKGLNDDDGSSPVIIDVCEVTLVSGAYQPSTVIESFSFNSTEWDDLPQNALTEIFVDDSLYTVGTKYALHFKINTWDAGDRNSRLVTTVPPVGDNAVGEYDYFSISDTYHNRNWSLIYRINKLGKVAFGQDTQNEKLMQTFTGLGDILKIEFQKAENIGTPTEDIEFYIQEVNGLNLPIGDKIISHTMKLSEYDLFNEKNYFSVPLQTNLDPNKTYGIILAPIGQSDANYRQLFYSSISDGYSGGRLRQYDGANWNNVDYDLRFKIYESGVGKIVKVDNSGKVNDALIDFPILFHDQVIETLSGGSAVSQYNRNKITVVASPDGDYIANWNSYQPTSPISIYKVDKKTGIVRFVRNIAVSGFSGQSRLGACFGNGKTMYIAMNNTTSPYHQRIWEIADIEDLTVNNSFDYDDGNHVFEHDRHMTVEMFFHKNILYLGYGGDDFTKINPSTWANLGVVSNIGVNISYGALYFTSVNDEGHLVMSNGATYEFDGVSVIQVDDAFTYTDVKRYVYGSPQYFRVFHIRKKLYVNLIVNIFDREDNTKWEVQLIPILKK